MRAFVRDDGTLFYPFIGSVQVEGLTLGRNCAKLSPTGWLAFIEQPQVGCKRY